MDFSLNSTDAYPMSYRPGGCHRVFGDTTVLEPSKLGVPDNLFPDFTPPHYRRNNILDHVSVFSMLVTDGHIVPAETIGIVPQDVFEAA